MIIPPPALARISQTYAMFGPASPVGEALLSMGNIASDESGEMLRAGSFDDDPKLAPETFAPIDANEQFISLAKTVNTLHPHELPRFIRARDRFIESVRPRISRSILNFVEKIDALNACDAPLMTPVHDSFMPRMLTLYSALGIMDDEATEALALAFRSHLGERMAMAIKLDDEFRFNGEVSFTSLFIGLASAPFIFGKEIWSIQTPMLLASLIAKNETGALDSIIDHLSESHPISISAAAIAATSILTGVCVALRSRAMMLWNYGSLSQAARTEWRREVTDQIERYEYLLPHE